MNRRGTEIHTRVFIRVQEWSIGQRLGMRPSILQSSNFYSNLFVIPKLHFFPVLR